MLTTKTMRVTNVREVPVQEGEPTSAEMFLADDGVPFAAEGQRIIVPIAEQRPVGTKFTVSTTFTEITE